MMRFPVQVDLLLKKDVFQEKKKKTTNNGEITSAQAKNEYVAIIGLQSVSCG